MRIVPLALLLAFLSGLTAEAHTAALLLNGKTLKRLSREHERQTPRWLNFEKRIKTADDSPERGFELALFSIVSADTARAHEAIAWALAHPKDIRQTALVLDWCGEAASADERAALMAALKGASSVVSFQARRDCVFAKLAVDGDMASCTAGDLDTSILLYDSAELYAACEYFLAVRANGADDQRRQDPQFFQHLPVEFLLARKPQEVQHPDWRSHAAALALVSLDPNLEASQFLQGWAVEDGQTLREGPGVAYEFLWADPYLPGIAYQNLDPWFYELEGSRLFARTDWTTQACWISVSAKGVQQQGCPAGWQQTSTGFGSLKLIPATVKCLDIPHQDVKESIVIWKLRPGEKITYRDTKEITAQADSAGMWRPGTNVESKVCAAK